MQPYFLPFVGYFQLIASVDKFVVYDDVAFIKRGWINRNTLFVNGQRYLMTIPLSNGKRGVLIRDLIIAHKANNWKNQLLKTVRLAYSRAPFFSEVFPWFESQILSPHNSICQLNIESLLWVCKRNGISTEFVTSSTIYGNQTMGRSERLVDICKKEGGTCYINAIGGKELYDQEQFTPSKIKLRFIASSTPPYPQSTKVFAPGLSILDAMMHLAPEQINEMMLAGCILK